jgi:ribose transport system permease protein
MLASTISSGSPSAGQQYLLPTFAAAFVGATQFKGGRMNVWGTILAVLMIGVGTAGLGFVSTRDWPQEMFEGLALIAALAASSWATNLIATSAPWRRIVTPLKSAMPGGGRSG